MAAESDVSEKDAGAGEGQAGEGEAGSCSAMDLAEDSSLFRALGEEERQHLLESGNKVSFAPGEVILREGEEGRSFFLLEAGEVEVSTECEGERVVLATLSTGAVFGEVPAFSDRPRTATVVAVGPVEALRFENDELKALLDRRPAVRDELQALVLDRARDTIEKIVRKRT